jgi:hypothetical protein
MSKSVPHTLETRAVEALQNMLAQISGVRLKSIESEPSAPGRAVDLRAHLDIYSHSHTLLCKVRSSGERRDILTAVEMLRSHADGISSAVTPLLIMPCLSLQAQDLCRERNIGYLDLEGNVRLMIDEIFIVRRSQPCLGSRQSIAPTQARDSTVRRGFAPHRAEGTATNAATTHRMAS